METVEELAKELKVSIWTVRHLIANKSIQAVKVGRALRVREADYEKYLRGAKL